MNKNLINEWDNILTQEKKSPYVFRTRLERNINKTIKYAVETDNEKLKLSCEGLKEKLCYISDQSNQTSEGCLNSFIVLKKDIVHVRNMMGVNI